MGGINTSLTFIAITKIIRLATDTFFLEKHEDKNFGYWFQNDQTMKEAENCLSKHLAGRKKPQNDLKYYMEDMVAFREFLKDRDK